MAEEAVPSHTRDKTTIGLTPKARRIAERIKEQEGLDDLLDIAVIGMGVALNSGVGIGSAKDSVTTWNVGTFDGNGYLRELVSALYDDLDTPFRQIEYLVNTGLEQLATEYDGAESSSNLTSILKRLT